MKRYCSITQSLAATGVSFGRANLAIGLSSPSTLEVWNFFDDVTSGTCLPSDVNNDNVINTTDLLLVLSGWGSPFGILDLLGVLSSWGDVCERLGSCCQPNGSCTFVAESVCDGMGGQCPDSGSQIDARWSQAVHHSACAFSRCHNLDIKKCLRPTAWILAVRSVETKPSVPTSTAAKNSTTSALMPSPLLWNHRKHG